MTISSSEQSVLDDLKGTSDKISVKVWSISIGVIAFGIAFIFGDSGTKTAVPLSFEDLVVPISLSFLALVLDLTQYIVGYLNSWNALVRVKEDPTKLPYKKTDKLYRLRNWLFAGKCIICFGGSIWLVIILAIRAIEVHGKVL